MVNKNLKKPIINNMHLMNHNDTTMLRHFGGSIILFLRSYVQIHKQTKVSGNISTRSPNKGNAIFLCHLYGQYLFPHIACGVNYSDKSAHGHINNFFSLTVTLKETKTFIFSELHLKQQILTPNVQAMKERIDMLHFFKIKNFCSLKDSMKRMKR